jgi:hypothetical protein
MSSRISSGNDGDTCDGENDADDYCNNNNNNNHINMNSNSDINFNRSSNDGGDLDGNSSIRINSNSDSNRNSDSNSGSNDTDDRRDSGMHCAINGVDGGGSLTNTEIIKRRKRVGNIGSPNNKKQKIMYDSESEVHAKVRKKSRKKSKIVSIRSCLWGLAFLEKIE